MEQGGTRQQNHQKGASWQFHKFKIGSKTQQEMEHFTIKDGFRKL